MHWRNVLVEGSILGVPGAGQLELLGSVGELEGGVGVGRVWKQGALPLQQIPHSLQELAETEGQGGLPQAVQLLARGHRNIYIKPNDAKPAQLLFWRPAWLSGFSYLIEGLGLLWKLSCVPQDLLHVSLWRTQEIDIY